MWKVPSGTRRFCGRSEARLLGGREFRTDIELPAPVERVWRCLTDPAELTNWYPPEAEIVPGEGGQIRTRWGAEFDFVEHILHWEPPCLLRTRWGGELGEPTEVEIQISETSTGSRLHLVHGGIGSGSDWELFLDGITRGWGYELRALRHYLVHHSSGVRDFVFAAKKVAMPVEEAWERLGSEQGFGFLAINDLSSGATYDLTTPYGERMRGTIALANPPKDFVATWLGLNNAFFRWQVDPSLEGATVYCSVNAYGIGDVRRQQVQNAWSAAMDRALTDLPGQSLWALGA